MATRECPFDHNALEQVMGERAGTLLLGMLISPTSTMFNMVKGSIRSNPNGAVMECPSCGWVAMFTRSGV